SRLARFGQLHSRTAHRARGARQRHRQLAEPPRISEIPGAHRRNRVYARGSTQPSRTNESTSSQDSVGSFCAYASNGPREHAGRTAATKAKREVVGISDADDLQTAR